MEQHKNKFTVFAGISVPNNKDNIRFQFSSHKLSSKIPSESVAVLVESKSLESDLNSSRCQGKKSSCCSSEIQGDRRSIAAILPAGIAVTVLTHAALMNLDPPTCHAVPDAALHYAHPHSSPGSVLGRGESTLAGVLTHLTPEGFYIILEGIISYLVITISPFVVLKTISETINQFLLCPWK